MFDARVATKQFNMENGTKHRQLSEDVLYPQYIQDHTKVAFEKLPTKNLFSWMAIYPRRNQ